MAGPPDPIRILALAFDEWNEEHLVLHGVEQKDVEEVLDNQPTLFRNLPERAGSHVIIGRRLDGRYFYIALRPTNARGVWYPLTGWSISRRRAQQLLGGA